MKSNLFRMFLLVLTLCLCLGAVACQTPNTPDPSESETGTDESESVTESDGNTEDSTDETTETESETESETLPPPTIEDITCALKSAGEQVRVIGRSRVLPNGITCDYSACGIEFNAYIEGDLKITLSTNKEAYFTVFIDGVRAAERVHFASGQTTVTLATFAEGGEHNIEFVKQTEAQNAICVLEKLTFRGYFTAKPADSELYIEFIGDSITCGYGNLCANGTASPGTALYQDATQAYAYLAAKQLGVDYSLVSVSGVGVSIGYRTFLASEMFGKESVYRDNVTYTVTRVPDIVVINLGTNDKSKGATEDAFIEQGIALVKQIRAAYGEDVPIVWMNGMMNDAMVSALLKVSKEFNKEDGNFYICYMDSNGAAGGGHPSIAAQEAAATKLVKFLQDKNLVEKK